MKETTKKEWGDFFKDLFAVAAVCGVVVATNKKCSSYMPQHKVSAKIEEKMQNEKMQILKIQRIR
jgi:hypothetical protein